MRECENVIKVNPPLKSDIRTIRLLIVCGIVAMLIFSCWFFSPAHVGYAPVYWLLTFALVFKLVKMLHEWYHYWSPGIPARPVLTAHRTVDVLTTSCPGEPREMIIRTLKAMKAISYPHTNYLCDEGNDPVLEKFCREAGIVYVTREQKINAKAGNINNALRQATGEICIVLDPDHEPVPEFIDRVLPYFEDPSVGFVQSVQAYGNQSESFIARGAAEQTYHFYGPMMMCMNSYGTVQAIGANCAFRRSALDSIGGHAAGLAEDMHTAMQLHAKGWRSVYIPEILTRGLVPATLSSYYKQQLKWSRGTFELLFRTFPALYRQFTWRQKIHYFTIPLYFLFGLINLIDIAVPVLALATAEVPWEIDLRHFAFYFLPLCTLSLIIRLFAQRWLLEKHERGFHFAGGILRMATWWIFLIGFVYTIFKIKVPYIPTPKEDEHQNYVRLSLPNLLIMCLSLLIVAYGLSIDWTPYSIAMASYALVTASMLAFTVLLSQQKFLAAAGLFCKRVPALKFTGTAFNLVTQKTQQVVYNFLRNGVIASLLAVSLIFLSYSNIKDENGDVAQVQKELGGFYLGRPLSCGNALEKAGEAFNLISFRSSWTNAAAPFPMNDMQLIRDKGAIPYIQWQLDADSVTEQEIYEAIRSGNYNSYLKRCAAFFRNYKNPVFLSFSVKAKEGAGGSPDGFVKSWQYLYTFFNNLGVSNITWVWCPSSAKDEASYPGEKFVDWIGVQCLNYGECATSKDRYAFSELYTPYRNAFGKYKKPIMITGLGSAKGPVQAEWFTAAFAGIRDKFSEVRAVLIYDGIKEIEKLSGSDTLHFRENFAISDEALSLLNAELRRDEFEVRKFVTSLKMSSADTAYHSPFVNGGPGKFQLLLHGRPYYIKGVAYNTAHDWRDGNMPLTRRRVVQDFTKIKEMGANTIRRYGMGIYDRNILNIAEEFDLNVLYGFWFDPKVDFYGDSARVKEYIADVEEKVMQYKHHKAVIAWSLGNESWGLLKHHYAKPYLTRVRDAYIRMIEHLAQRIHELDPDRPVFSCIEHESYQLPGELVAYRDGAPSVDVIGINSYYKEQIADLNHVAWQFDSLRPYLVSEFGPRGYWDPVFNKTLNGSVMEETDAEKSQWYREQWVKYVNGHKGYNVGGFAYCWHDRMEGSYTWFGLTDFKGRLKPAYYALKEEWTHIGHVPIAEAGILAPVNIIPGKEYQFTALLKKGNAEELNFEWRLMKDEYLEQVENIHAGEDPLSIRLTVPEEPSAYRLYLFVTDRNGQEVTTSSLPLKVSKKS